MDILARVKILLYNSKYFNTRLVRFEIVYCRSRHSIEVFMNPVDNKLTSRSPPRPDKPLKRSETLRTSQAFYDALRATDTDVEDAKPIRRCVEKK